jgi:hypothetical protein
MKLAFKRLAFGFTEKDVPILLKIGTLEDVCTELKIEFWQISDYIQKEDFEFSVEVLYQGYLTACKERFQKPKYDRVKATIWHEHMSQSAQKEYVQMMTELLGKVTKTFTKKKVEQN